MASLNEFRRLTGLDDPEWMESAKAKAPPVQTERHSPPYPGERGYMRQDLISQVMCEVKCCLDGLTKQLEGVAYTEEDTFGTVAEKIASGPIADMQKLVKGVGYAVSESFGNPSAPYSHDGRPQPANYRTDLYSCCVNLRGEVAEALAVGKIVVPDILAASTDHPSVNMDALAKLWPAFEKAANDRANGICDAVMKLDTALIKSRR